MYEDIKTAKDNDYMYAVKYMCFYTLRDGPFDLFRGWAGVFCR